MIKAFYFHCGNYGDMLTPYLLRQLWGLPVAHINTPAYADLVGVGSILESLTSCTTNTAIWGSGFIKPGPRLSLPPQTHVLAVRGPLTRNRIVNCHAPLGDPGLLVAQTIPSQSRKYQLGFIPHYIDHSTQFSQYFKQLPDVHYINIVQSPASFITEVAQCEYIISSSLHGLITADSFNIPNLHITISDQVIGDNYKFRDYYASLNKKHHYINLRPFLQSAPAQTNSTPSPQLKNLTPKYFISAINSIYTPTTNLSEIQRNLTSSFEQHFLTR